MKNVASSLRNQAKLKLKVSNFVESVTIADYWDKCRISINFTFSNFLLKPKLELEFGSTEFVLVGTIPRSEVGKKK